MFILEFISGVAAYPMGLFGLFYLGFMAVCAIIDHGEAFIQEKHNHWMRTEKVQEWLKPENYRDFPAKAVWTIVSGVLGLFFVLIFFIALPHGDGPKVLMFPYVVGTKVSLVLVPILTYAGVLYGGRMLCRLQKAAKKLKESLDSHIKDTNAHR